MLLLRVSGAKPGCVHSSCSIAKLPTQNTAFSVKRTKRGRTPFRSNEHEWRREKGTKRERTPFCSNEHEWRRESFKKVYAVNLRTRAHLLAAAPACQRSRFGLADRPWTGHAARARSARAKARLVATGRQPQPAASQPPRVNTVNIEPFSSPTLLSHAPARRSRKRPRARPKVNTVNFTRPPRGQRVALTGPAVALHAAPRGPARKGVGVRSRRTGKLGTPSAPPQLRGGSACAAVLRYEGAVQRFRAPPALDAPLKENGMPRLDEIPNLLSERSRNGLLRDPQDALTRRQLEATRSAFPRGTFDLSSNDYLGLARRSVSRETLEACHAQSAGAGASRLIHGSALAHEQLEQALASWVALPEALLFSSGYVANLSVVSALATQGDVIVSDALNHASLIDGCRLSRANVLITPHLDLGAIENALSAAPKTAACWVVVESYYSMDGNSPDLVRLRQLCDRYAAGLIVDEAHALGVFGPSGAGLCAAAGMRPDVLIGTLGKALGLQGAFAACEAPVRTWLWNSARGFVFSTAPSPLLCALGVERVAWVRNADAARDKLEQNIVAFRKALGPVQLPPGNYGPIIPVLVGDNRRALGAAEELRTQGVLTQAIRPPTVPTARLRLTLNADIEHADIPFLAQAVRRTLPN